MNIAVRQSDELIFAAVHAHKHAAARYAACASRCDVIGREMMPEDEAELDAACAEEDAAKEILRRAHPASNAGMRAIHEFMATAVLTYEETNAIAANLLASPALAA